MPGNKSYGGKREAAGWSSAWAPGSFGEGQESFYISSLFSEEPLVGEPWPELPEGSGVCAGPSNWEPQRDLPLYPLLH